MHETSTKQVVLPLYVSRFSCIGPDCEDTCCVGWNVTVDRKSFDGYKRAGKKAGARALPLLQRFADDVKPSTNKNKSNAAWGFFQLRPDTHACAFLEEGKCSIQTHMGETSLCDVCFSYPRGTSDIGGLAVQTLALSCPEAARLALLSADAFHMTEGHPVLRESLVAHLRPFRGLSTPQMKEIHLFCTTLIRSSDLALWQRLAVLGLFCEELSRALDAGGTVDSAALVARFIKTVQSGEIAEALSSMQPNHTLQAQLFAKLLQASIARSASAHHNRVSQAVAEGLGADPVTGRVSLEILVERYARGIERLPLALKEAPFFLEHVLLNDVLQNVFPFSAKSPLQHYMQLVSRFGVVRLMLAARCSGDLVPDVKELAATVQVFSRRFQYDRPFADLVNSTLEGSGWARLDKLYAFLRS